MASKKEFEKLYKENYKAVYYTALQLMHNEHDADDITQDTFITAFMKYGELKEADSFTAWVKRIAINKCMDQLRKKNPVPTEDEELELQMDEEVEENFLQEEYVLNEEKRKTVMNIMKSVLSSKQFETVVLFYYDELTVAEIANLQNVPEGTVLSRLSVSRAKIKKGVLEYEKKNNDKLYGLIMIPFLTRVLRAEAEEIALPTIIPESVLNAMNPDNITITETVKVAGKGITMKSKLLVAGIIGASVVAVGTVAAIVVIGGGVALFAGLKGNNSNKPGNTVQAGQSGQIAGNDPIASPDNESNIIKLAESDITHVDYDVYDKDGEYKGTLRAYTNNTNQDIYLRITYGDSVESSVFVPANGTSAYRFVGASKLGITDVSGFNIEETPYYPEYEYDRAEDYSMKVSEYKTSLEIVTEYIGDDPEPFQGGVLYEVVFFDANNNVLDIDHVTMSNTTSNIKKGDKFVGFASYARWNDAPYDHYEFFSWPNQKFYNMEFNDVITAKEISPYIEVNDDLGYVFEVSNSADIPMQGKFSVITYDAAGEIVATFHQVSTEDLEAKATTYISNEARFWNGYENFDSIVKWEYHLDYSQKVDVDSKMYDRDMTDQVSGNVQLREWGNDYEFVAKNNSTDESVKVYCYAIFYDATGNYVIGRVINMILDPGQEDDYSMFIHDPEVLEQIDHFDYFVRAMQYD